MKRFLLILILLSISSHATVEDQGGGMGLSEADILSGPYEPGLPGIFPALATVRPIVFLYM